MYRKLVDFGLVCCVIGVMVLLAWEQGAVSSAETPLTPTPNTRCFETPAPYPEPYPDPYPTEDNCSKSYLPITINDHQTDVTPTGTLIPTSTPTPIPTNTPTPTLTPTIIAYP